MIGRTLGHYRILSRLGGGGMGEVYVAEDTSLGRKVALKTLPAAQATDPERQRRFEREARSVAALNHPNIVTLYSVDEADGIRFLTMELVQGKTLTELLPKGGLPLPRFFELALPLVEAVAAAHQQGITHRDLKPDNVMITDDGRLKVLDFGLAKLREEAGPVSTQSRLLTQSVTGEGRIVGTVAYMSPEQAEGKPVDHGSDIFSLGILLYEMATGQRPFQGETTVSVISSILKDTPAPVSQVRASLPRDLARILGRCLAKNPSRRFQTALDLRNELEELKAELDTGALEVTDLTTAIGSERRKGIWLGAAGIAVGGGVVVAALVIRLGGRAPAPVPAGPVAKEFIQVTRDPGAEQSPSLSPDGKTVIYVAKTAGNRDIYSLRVGGENPINLTHDSPVDDDEPAFSPDGEQIAFRSSREGGGLFVMGASGESVRRLTDSGSAPSWSPDGEEIFFATEQVLTPYGRGARSEIWVVNVTTGEKRKVFDGDGVQPSVSPHGKRIAYWAVKGGQRDIWTIPIAGGTPIPVTQDPPTDWAPVWSPDGEFLYYSSDRGGVMNLWRIAIDEESGRALAQPQPMTTSVMAAAQTASLSADGRKIVYAATVETANLQKLSFDPALEAVVGEPAWITQGTSTWDRPDVSPDGRSVAFQSTGKQEDIFVMRADGTGRRQLTNDAFKDRGPVWSPDGSKIAFYSNRSGDYRVWLISPDGSGLKQAAEQSTSSAIWTFWSPDGSRLAFGDFERATYVVDMTRSPAERSAALLFQCKDQAKCYASSWSPDGRLLALTFADPAATSTGIGFYSVSSGEITQLTHDTGFYPLWLADSRRLLYWRTGNEGLYLTDARTGKSKAVFSAAPDTLTSFFALSRDNRSIYVARGTLESDLWLLTLESPP